MVRCCRMTYPPHFKVTVPQPLSYCTKVKSVAYWQGVLIGGLAADRVIAVFDSSSRNLKGFGEYAFGKSLLRPPREVLKMLLKRKEQYERRILPSCPL